MKRYDNGEPVTKGRMEDEEWYSEYQSLMELSIGNDSGDVDELLQLANKSYREVFGKDYPDQAQMLRWCVLQADRGVETAAIIKAGKWDQ